MGVCVTPHTWRRSQLDGEVKMEDRRGMGERLTQRSLNYFITNGHPGWTSHYRNIYVTTNYAIPRKRLAALDFALDRFGALTHMANIFTTFSTCMQSSYFGSCNIRGHCEHREWQFIRGMTLSVQRQPRRCGRFFAFRLAVP